MFELVNKIKFYVTDRCNEKCFYCPIHGENAENRISSFLDADQIIKISKSAIDLGFLDVKLSGEYGEALTRKDLLDIVSGINKSGAREISIATNGIGLKEKIDDLISAGANKFCISLDTLDASTYKTITGVNKIEDVKEGIAAAARHLGRSVKINFVALANHNVQEIPAMIDWAADIGATLQLIELYSVHGRESQFASDHFSLHNIANDLRSRSIFSSRYKPRQMETFVMRDGSRIEITGDYDDSMFGDMRLIVHPDGRLGNYDVRETGLAVTGDESDVEISAALAEASQFSRADMGRPGVTLWGLERPTVS